MTARGAALAALAVAAGLGGSVAGAARREPFTLAEAADKGALVLERVARRLGPAGITAELASGSVARRKAALAAVPLLDEPARALPGVADLMADARAPADLRAQAAELAGRIAGTLDPAGIAAAELEPEIASACGACARVRAAAEEPELREHALRCAIVLARLGRTGDATRLVLEAVTEPALARAALELARPAVPAERALLDTLAAAGQPGGLRPLVGQGPTSLPSSELAAVALAILCDAAPGGRADAALVARVRAVPDQRKLPRGDAARLARCVKGTRPSRR